MPIALLVVQAVADDKAVGNLKAAIKHRNVRQPAHAAVEQRAHLQAARMAFVERAQQVTQGQARIDDVLDEQDVLAFDARIEILDDANQSRLTGGGERPQPVKSRTRTPTTRP